MKEMSLLAAIKDYFGFKPGQTLMEFRDECAALTADDRAYLSREFEKVGYKIVRV